MRFSTFASLLALVVAGTLAQGQASGDSLLEAGTPFLRVFNPKDYRGSASNWAFVQDPRGVIYAGNEDGILEYDGQRWRLIRVTNKTVVRSLAVDASGQVWAGAIGELGRLEPDETGQMRYVSLVEQLPSGTRDFADVWQTHATPEGVVFMSNKRLFRFHGKGVQVFTPETSFQRSFLVRNRLFVRQRKQGLFELKAGRLEGVAGGERFSQEAILAMLPRDGPGTSSEEAILVRQKQGFFLWDGESYQPFRTEIDGRLEHDVYYAATGLADGRLAVGTLHGGLFILDREGRWIGRLDRTRGLPDDGVLALFPDREGGLWLGLNRGIVHVQSGLPLTRYDERPGLPGAVLSLCRHAGRLYAGTSQGLFRLEPGPEPLFQPISGIETQTWDFLPVGEALLVASHQGVFEVQGDTALVVTKDLSSSALLASRVVPGRVYVGFVNGVASLRREGTRWVEDERFPGISADVRTLLEMPDGRLWAGTQASGLFRLSFSGNGPGGAAPKVEHFDVSHGLPDLNFDYVYPVGGEPLFSTRDGVFRFDESRGRFGPDPRFAHLFPDGPRRVFSLWEDRQGKVWMHSQDESRDVHATGAAVPQSDGLYRWDARPLQPASGSGIWIIRTDPDGVGWFGGDDGLFRYDPGVAKSYGQRFQTLVREVSHPGGGTVVFGGASQRTSPVLAYRDNSLRFEYAAPFFEGPDAMRFQVLLEGNDRDWSTWTAEGHREYTNLLEGAYRFRVRARNIHGTLGEEGVFAFRVRPPWFRSMWAYFCYLIAGSGLLWGAVNWRIRRVQAEKRELEAIVASRTSELRAKNGELATLNSRLEEAQERISRLLVSTPAASEGIALWSRKLGGEIAGAVGATALGVWEVEHDTVTPLSDCGIAPPSLEELQVLLTAGGHAGAGSGAGTVIPVVGLSGELRGAIVIQGRGVTWGDIERRMVEGFAHQLGAALDMNHLRTQLHMAQERRAATRREMHERGVATLQICPSCGRCYNHEPAVCEADGAKLESPRPIPFRFLDRYRFVRVLGQGGMGLVLSAHDERLGREVAVKLVRPEHFNDASFKQRFEREARVVARIQHPGIIHLHDSGELDDGTAYLVMEKLEGRDLRVLLNTWGPGKPSQVAQLVTQGSAALAAAHRAGVVHRDIKPENVFFADSDGGYRFKILDFGLAKSLRHEKGLTQTGVVVGTPAYMAPEQVQGEDVDARADLYSFAAVAFEALTGRKAIQGSELGDVLIQVLKEIPPAVSTLIRGMPAEVDAAFESALAKDPERRPRSVELWCASFAGVLEQFVSDRECHGWPEPRTVSTDGGDSQNRSLTVKIER